MDLISLLKLQTEFKLWFHSESDINFVSNNPVYIYQCSSNKPECIPTRFLLGFGQAKLFIFPRNYSVFYVGGDDIVIHSKNVRWKCIIRRMYFYFYICTYIGMYLTKCIALFFLTFSIFISNLNQIVHFAFFLVWNTFRLVPSYFYHNKSSHRIHKIRIAVQFSSSVLSFGNDLYLRKHLLQIVFMFECFFMTITKDTVVHFSSRFRILPNRFEPENQHYTAKLLLEQFNVWKFYLYPKLVFLQF